MAAGPDGLIFSAKEYEYSLEVWDQDGGRRAGFKGPQLNETLPQPGPFTWDNPYVNRVAAIGLDEPHRLWLAVWQLRPDWRDRTVEVVSPNGTLYILPDDDLMTTIYRTRIDVVDLDELSIVGTHELDGLLLRFLPGRRAVAAQYDHEGNLQIAIWQLKPARCSYRDLAQHLGFPR